MLSKVFIRFECVEDSRNQGIILIGGKEFNLEFKIIDINKLDSAKKFEMMMASPNDTRYWYDLKLDSNGTSINLSDDEKRIFCLIIRKVEVASTILKMDDVTIIHATENRLIAKLDYELSNLDCVMLMQSKFGCKF